MVDLVVDIRGKPHTQAHRALVDLVDQVALWGTVWAHCRVEETVVRRTDCISAEINIRNNLLAQMFILDNCKKILLFMLTWG